MESTVSNSAMLDIGTAEAWARHQRKMRTQTEVARIKRILAARSVWLKLVRRGGEWRAQIGHAVREGVRIA